MARSPLKPTVQHRRPRHLVAVADVGGSATYHVGDEAMLAADLTALRRHDRGLRFTVVSRDPEATAHQHTVDAIAPIGFPAAGEADEAERLARLNRVLRAAQCRADGCVAAAGGLGHQVIEALSEATGLLICGGGNLCSSWPEHLWERVALLRIAHILGVPSVVLGQTLGPCLSETEREVLACSLPFAALVGARELPSAALATGLGVLPERPLVQPDDALFLREEAPAQAWLREFALSGEWIAITIHPLEHPTTPGGLLAQLAEQLRGIRDAVPGIRFLFIPHLASDDEERRPSDLAIGRRLAEALRPAVQLSVAQVLPAAETAWLTRRAAMVLSTRYHPLVFAQSAGVPGLGIYVDAYTRVKLRGALQSAGLDGWSISLAEALNGRLVELTLALWGVRDRVRQRLLGHRAAWQREEERKWARAIDALGLASRLPWRGWSRRGRDSSIRS